VTLRTRGWIPGCFPRISGYEDCGYFGRLPAIRIGNTLPWICYRRTRDQFDRGRLMTLSNWFSPGCENSLTETDVRSTATMVTPTAWKRVMPARFKVHRTPSYVMGESAMQVTWMYAMGSILVVGRNPRDYCSQKTVPLQFFATPETLFPKPRAKQHTASKVLYQPEIAECYLAQPMRLSQKFFRHQARCLQLEVEKTALWSVRGICKSSPGVRHWMTSS